MDNKGSCSVTTACSTTDKKSGDCGPKKGCCEKLFQGTFVGGIVMFIYFMMAWTVLPWHTHGLMAFKNEPLVAKALLAGAPESGVYVLPMKATTGKGAIDKPFAFVNVKTDGADAAKSMHNSIERELVLCLFLASILTCLMMKQSSGCPIGFSIKVGLFAALAHNMPDLVWWHYPINFTLMSAADDVLSAMVAGFFISKFVLCSGKKASDCGTKTCPGCGCAAGQCKCGGGSCGTKKMGCGA